VGVQLALGVFAVVIRGATCSRLDLAAAVVLAAVLPPRLLRLPAWKRVADGGSERSVHTCTRHEA